MLGLILLGNERRHVRFESSDADTEDDETDREGRDGAIGVSNNLGKGSDDENYVAHNSDEDGDLNRLEAPPVLVGHICTH